MSFTYGELKQAIQDYVENDEATFVSNLPLFIRLAEERIFKNVQLNLFQKNTTLTTVLGDEFLAVPADFLAPFSLSLDVSGAKNFLEFKDVDFVQTYTPDPATTGLPRYYAQYDVGNFILGPTPDAAYTANLHYLYRPASLTAGADSGTTWLSENAEVSLLYGALVEAYIFMKGEPQFLQLYNQRFAESLGRVKELGEAKETTDEYRAGPIRRPRT